MKKYQELVQVSIAQLALAWGLTVGAGSPAHAQSLVGAKASAATVSADIPKGAEAPVGYRIGPGDTLQIDVWKEPEASTPVTVRSDGVITLPMVKEISVRGMTPRELEAVLTEKLARFFHEPDVTVMVKEIHSEKVYLVGAVRKEGPIPLQAPLTVLQAVAEAGGLTDYAKRGKIYILRQENSKQVRIPFDYQAVIKGQHMESNISLRPGDTVVVPQ